MKGDRIAWVDQLKGFSIFCVVLGHLMPVLSENAMDITTLCGGLNGVIMSFNMPLFAILSGYFFSDKIGIKEFLIKKCKQLVLPYFVWCIIVFVAIPNIKLLLLGERIYILSSLRNLYYGLVDWGWWFIRALFLCFIYAYFAFRLFRNSYIQTFLFSTLFIFILSFGGIIPNKLHFSLGFIFLYPFFGLGYLIRNYYWSFLMLNIKTVCIIAFVIWVVLFKIFWHGAQDTFYGMNTSIFVANADSIDPDGIAVVYKTINRLVIGSVSSIALLALAYWIEISHPNIFIGLFRNIGRNTFGIYILQSLIFTNLNYKTKILDCLPLVNLIMCFMIALLICVVLSYCVSYTAKNDSIGLLLWGKKR